MARPRSAAKRQAILDSAVHEIAQAGLSASTASIAKGANLAEGTLFTYFATKTDLLNELYVELKSEVYRRVNAGFPHHADLSQRAHHVWTETLRWAIERPDQRKVSMHLNASTLVTEQTRKSIGAQSAAVAKAMRELSAKGAFKDLPPGFASSAITGMQDAVLETIARRPRQKAGLIDNGFKAFWRMVE